VRCLTKLTGGVNTWEVRIDRCISKNIFIGVVVDGAKMDNYVGCDVFGWAFLANKAIWHNKSKMKAYGELFRAGDIIAVTLDLVLGTLSFAVNGKNLGIAADGLSGEFYPAFSLYNDDDQITLLPPRSSTDCRPSPALSWSSTPTESLLDRMQTLDAAVRLLSGGYVPATAVSRDSSADWETALSLVEEELLLRHNLWISSAAGGSVRTVLATGEVVSIIMSPVRESGPLSMHSQGQMQGVLYPGMRFLWENHRQVQLLGYASNRLWVQCVRSGDVFGSSEETVRQQMLQSLLQQDMPGSGDQIDSPPMWTVPEAAAAVAEPVTTMDLTSLRQVLRNFLRRNDWGLCNDEALLRELESCASRSGVGLHPSLLTYGQAVAVAPTATNTTTTETERAVRISLLLMANDIFQALLPILPRAFDVGPGVKAEAAANNETDDVGAAALFRGLKGLIFCATKREYAAKCTPVGLANSVPADDPAAFHSQSPVLKSLHVQPEEAVLEQLLTVTEATARPRFFTHSSWRLLAGLQATVSVQLVVQLEAQLDTGVGLTLEQMERALCTTTLPRAIEFGWLSAAASIAPICTISIALGGPEGHSEGSWFGLRRVMSLAASQLQSAVSRVQSGEWSAQSRPEVSMLFVYCQTAGMTCGLALNNRVPFPAHLPIEFIKILVSPPSSPVASKSEAYPGAENGALLSLCAHSFRRGLISIFPESALMLFTEQDFQRTLSE
jgi:hypothetical protein